MRNEKLIISKVLAGDMKAFKVLFDTYYPQVRFFVLGIVKDAFATDDIAQNVFIKVWTKRALIDPEKSFNNYLYSITKNEVIDYFRSKVAAESLDTVKQIQDQDNTGEMIESVYDLSHIKDIVIREIERMPLQRRSVFIMSRMQGLSNDEIAEKLHLSKRTVERHLNMALHTLKEKLGDFICWLTLFVISF